MEEGEFPFHPMCQTPSFLRRSLCKQEVMDWTDDGWMVDASRAVGLSTNRVGNPASSTPTETAVGSNRLAE